VKKGILTISSLMLTVALAQGGLVIQANGDQETDANGVTTMNQGGTVTDNVNGITIKGSFIKVKDGAFLNATNATIITAQKQSIAASKIDWNIATDRMALTGPLSVSTEEVKSLSSSFAIAYPKSSNSSKQRRDRRQKPRGIFKWKIPVPRKRQDQTRGFDALD
jgi:hypothetical protein